MMVPLAGVSTELLEHSGHTLTCMTYTLSTLLYAFMFVIYVYLLYLMYVL